MTTNAWWCELAVIDGVVRRGVSIDVDEGRFSTVVPDTAPRPGAICLSGVTIPGLANTHSHAFHRALRSRTQAGTGSFWTWRDVMYEAAERLDPDRYFHLARAVFAEMVSAGHVVVGEFHYVHHQLDGSPYADPNAMGTALLAAAREAGLRITLLDTVYLHGGLTEAGHTPVAGVQLRYCDRTFDAWARRVHALPTGDRHRVGAAIHSVRAVDPDSMAKVAAWCREHDAPLHAHVSEQVAENLACVAHYGTTPVEVLARAGALGPGFCAVHATHLSASDVVALAAVGATVCLCPTTERDLGDGIGPSTELRDAGVAIHLGSDSHAVVDPLVEARAVELDERLRSERRGLHTAQDLLAMATHVGHAAIGWQDAGRIAVGQRADLVAVRLDSPRTAGTPDELATEAVVFAATASDVTDVVIDGEHVVAGGAHRTIDVAYELDASIRELMP